MNRKVVAGVVFVLSSVVCALVKRKADRSYLRDAAADQVQAEKCTDDLVAYTKAVNQVGLRSQVLEREKKQLKEQFAEWKKAEGIEKKKKNLYSAEDKALKEFKKTFGYQEALDKLETEKQESLDAFRTSIDYDDKIEELNEAIKDAEKKWEDQSKLFSSADDGISETANKLKHAAEDAKDAAVKKAKEQIAELEKNLDAETDIWDKKIQKTKREYEEKINREKNRLHEKTAKAINKLDEECDQAYQDLCHDIQNKRTDDEFEAITFYDDNCKLIETHDRIDELKALEIFQNTPAHERLAWWFKEHHWGKAVVLGTGMLPALAVGFLVSEYFAFLLKIVRAM